MRKSWDQAKGELVEYAHRAYERGLVAGSGGNVSVRTPDGNMLITSSGISLADAAPQNLIRVNLDTLEWDAEHGLMPSREFVYHAQILRLREDVSSVMHVHPPYVMAWGLTHTTLPFRDDVGYKLPEIVRVPLGEGPGPQLHEEVIQYVRSYPGARALYVERHGLTTLGESPRAAYELAHLLESLAKVSYLAQVLSKLSLAK